MKFHVLIASFLTLTTLSCGGQNDNRIVLHSESENTLQISSGIFKGITLNKTVLRKLIPSQLNDISEVSDISTRPLNAQEKQDIVHRLGVYELLNISFVISFTAKTTPDTDPPNAIYREISCISLIESDIDNSIIININRNLTDGYHTLVLFECGNNQVLLSKLIALPLTQVLH